MRVIMITFTIFVSKSLRIEDGVGFDEGSKRQLISLSITLFNQKTFKKFIFKDPLSGYFVIKRKVFEMVLPNLSGISFLKFY